MQWRKKRAGEAGERRELRTKRGPQKCVNYSKISVASNMTTQNHWKTVANHLKTRISERAVDNANSRLSGSKLLNDMKNGQCLSKWEPELCIKMLQLPGLDNYLAIKKLLQKANKEWIVEFLERDGLGTLLNSLRTIGGKSLTDTMAQLQCVECLRAVVRSHTGLHYISTHLEYASNLASAVTVCNNTIVKLQVYDLLCALCMFSADGMLFVKSVLSYIKVNQKLRHDCEIVVTELQQADTFAYQTSLMAFVNCLIIVEQNPMKRMRIRNELLGLGLQMAIDNMAGYEDEALQIQITVFEEHQIADENQMPIMSHQELFDKLRSKVSNTLYDSYLQNILLKMSEMDYSDTKINEIWSMINEVVCSDSQKLLEVYRKTSKTHSTGSQTTETRLNKNLTPNIRRHSLDVSKDKRAITKTKRLSLPTVHRFHANTISNERSNKKTVQSSKSTQTDRVNMGTDCNQELNNNHLILSDVNCDEKCKFESLDSLRLSPIPSVSPLPFFSKTPSPLPLLNESETPQLPPFPNLTGIPAPPPFPCKSEIPLPPPFPNLTEIPVPPPLPCKSEIPLPPPLPNLTGIPVPPPLPCKFEIPLPPPLPILSEIPPPPPFPSVSVIPNTSSLQFVEEKFPLLPTSPRVGPPLPSQLKESTSTPQLPPPPPPPPLVGLFLPSMSIPPTPSHSPSSSMSFLELNPTIFDIPNISDGHRTVPSRRASNNVKYYSLPKTKMKVLNWTKVNSQHLDKSVWSSADLPNLTINFKKIDELFCQKPRAKSSPAVISTRGLCKVNVLNILDSKRSLAINIMLKQFKSGSTEILDALQNGTSIPIEKLKGLQRVLPTGDEIKQIKKEAGNSITIGTAEQFCLNLDSISNYQLKIKLMIEKEELPTTVSEIRSQLANIKEMCYNLKTNQPFRQFLSLVLLVGNYLNAGSYAGNASGFTLDTLPKLLDTRANKPRVTFLHFIVEVAQANTNEILSFTKYTSSLRSLSRISFSSLEDEIKSITNQIQSLHSELSKQTKKTIHTQFSGFMKQAVEDVNKLNEEYKSTVEAIGIVAVHFGEDVKKFKIEECFALLGNFFERIDVVTNENNNRRIQEEKNNLLTMKMKNETGSPNLKRVMRKPVVLKEEEVCIVDMVLQEIRRGSFNLRSVKSQSEKHI